MLRLKNTIRELESDSDTIFEALLTQFSPLLLKYSAKLSYEDSYQDLQLFLVQIIRRTQRLIENFENDFSLLSYISKSVYSEYIRLSKRRVEQEMVLYFNQMSEEQEAIIERSLSSEDDHFSSEYSFIKSQLTENEYSIIIKHYVMGYSIAEIAKHSNVARQNVNKAKVKALNKLKSQIVSQ